MPEWLTFLLADTSALQLVFWIIAIGALVTVIVKLWPALRQLVTIVDSVTGLPAFIARTDADVARMKTQLENSHVTNLRDDITDAVEAVERVELGVKGLYQKVDELTQADADIRAELEDTQTPKETS